MKTQGVKDPVDVITLILGLFNYDVMTYNLHLEDPVDILVDGKWYICKIRNLPDIQHLLSVHPIDKNGRMNIRFDTGACGDKAMANDLRPAEKHLAGCGAQQHPGRSKPYHDIGLVWDSQAGNDGSRLFYGNFEWYRPAKEAK